MIFEGQYLLLKVRDPSIL